VIPLCIPNIGDEEIKRVGKVLRSGWLAHGPQNKELEEKFAEYIGVEHAVALNSCTSALQLAIQALDLRGEIIVPSFTFVASANAIVTAGCEPVFAEIDYDTCNIDPSKIEEKITEKTVGIMPVHFAGQSCKMDEITEIAEKHELVVIEDSAECIGGEYKGKKTGAFGIGCFSFFPTNNITPGEGGMLTTDDGDLAEKVNIYKGHGISSTTWSRERDKKPWIRAAILPGYNYRMSDVLAAIGVEQLKKLDVMNELRRKHARYLNKELGNFEDIETPEELKECRHVYQMYTIKLRKSIDRTEFISKMRELGIGVSVHFDPPVHLQPYYVETFGYKNGDFPVTEDVSERIITLPMYPQLKKEQLDEMVSSIHTVLGGLR
jgi:perosamine synthetase